MKSIPRLMAPIPRCINLETFRRVSLSRPNSELESLSPPSRQATIDSTLSMQTLTPTLYPESSYSLADQRSEAVAAGESKDKETLRSRQIAAGPSGPIERVLTTIRGRKLDVTGLGLDKDYLDALPDEIREQTVLSQLVIQRSEAVAVGEESTDISGEFLEAPPPEIREGLLQQEASDRRRREEENTRRRQQAASGGGGAIAEEMDPASFGESKDQETLRNRRTEFEDSAYGTASHGQSSGVKAALPTDTNAVERQIDDIGTEYSETSMTESRNLGYMEHFANDLYAVISKVQCDPQGIQTLSGLLPELLQQFALRIGQEVPRKDGREVMYYVHKHRK